MADANTTTDDAPADTNWVCAEMTYSSGEYGDDTCDVHSDICPPGHTPDGLSDPTYREFIHQCLDEWLNNSHGSGYFVVGDPGMWQTRDD